MLLSFSRRECCALRVRVNGCSFRAWAQCFPCSLSVEKIFFRDFCGVMARDAHGHFRSFRQPEGFLACEFWFWRTCVCVCAFFFCAYQLKGTRGGVPILTHIVHPFGCQNRVASCGWLPVGFPVHALGTSPSGSQAPGAFSGVRALGSSWRKPPRLAGRCLVLVSRLGPSPWHASQFFCELGESGFGLVSNPAPGYMGFPFH